MTAPRTRFVATISFGLLSLAATAAGAQGSGGAGGVVMRSAPAAVSAQNHREIPLATARLLVAAHHPDVIDGSLDPAMITLILDSNNNYVTSVANKPAVVVRAPDGSVAAAGGGFVVAGAVSAAASTAPRQTTAASGSGSGSGGGGGGGGSVSASINIAGIGPIDATLIEEMFWTNYAAGDLGPNPVRVRFVILKAAK